MRGFVVSHNLSLECLHNAKHVDSLWVYDNRLNKFYNDTVCLLDNNGGRLLDGYITNIPSVLESSEAAGWQEYLANITIDGFIQDIKKLRGGFGGYIYDAVNDDLLIYTDQISNKTIYYYIEGDKWLISNNVSMMLSVLRYNHIEVSFHEMAAEYMLSYGYMLDDCTYIEGVRRLLPGQFLRNRRDTSGKSHLTITRYHLISNIIHECSEAEALNMLDNAFRTAISREFDKDREYGFKHLVDLSGGLDSRMVSWVAHEMGYTDQLNVCYCKKDYMDETVSRKIAGDLGHEYYFESLDDAEWLMDVDKTVQLNNGAALYSGITGGRRVLDALSDENFGIEHTGMIGDSIIGTFYKNEELNYSKPRLGLNKYSDLMEFRFSDEILSEYPTQEMFVLYTRGMLGAQSSFILRQNFFDTGSVFEDVDFMEVMYSIPFRYRNNHNLYLKWINKYYPASTRYGWEKWGGVWPKKSMIPIRMVRTAVRLAERKVRYIQGKAISDTMNPIDYWYEQKKDIQQFFQDYYDTNMPLCELSSEIKEAIARMFTSANVTDKAMALTILAMNKNVRING